MSDDHKSDQIAQTLAFQVRAVDNYFEEKKYREDLEDPPPRIAKLPIARGYPVPWFVAKIGGQWEFRSKDPQKETDAYRFRLCWVCGEKLGTFVTFIIGPMCVVNRISGDPGMHKDCSEWTSRNCPFLSKPTMVRREDAISEHAVSGGIMIKRNPGCHALWECKNWLPRREGDGWICQLDEPTSVRWHTERRIATRYEVDKSIEEGLPILREMAQQQGIEAEAALEQMIIDSLRFLPKFQQEDCQTAIICTDK